MAVVVNSYTVFVLFKSESGHCDNPVTMTLQEVTAFAVGWLGERHTNIYPKTNSISHHGPNSLSSIAHNNKHGKGHNRPLIL